MSTILSSFFGPLLPAKKRERDGCRADTPGGTQPLALESSFMDQDDAVLSRESSMDSTCESFAPKRARRTGCRVGLGPCSSQEAGIHSDARTASKVWDESSFISYDDCDDDPCTPSQRDESDYYCPRTPRGRSTGLAGALLTNAQVYPILCALVRREQLAFLSPHKHANGRARETLAELFALLERGNYMPHEVNPELILCMLWILDSWHSQYKSRVDVCLRIYLALHPDPQSLVYYFKSHMLALQPQVLQRLGWNARVDYEIVRSDAALSCHSEHATILSFVGREVMQRCSASTGMPSSESATSSGLPNAHSQDLASLPYIFDRAVSVY